MSDGKKDHLSGKPNLSALNDENHVAAISNGASVTSFDALEAKSHIPFGVFAAGTYNIPSDTTISVNGESGTNAPWGGGSYATIVSQQGSSQDITIAGGVVTSAGGWPLYPTNYYSGSATVIVGAGDEINGVIVSSGADIVAITGGIVDNATVYGGGTAQALQNGVIDGATGLTGGTIIAGSAGTVMAGDSLHNVSNATATAGGTIIASNGGTVANVVASGSWFGGLLGVDAGPVGATINIGSGGVASGATAAAYGTLAVGEHGSVVSGLISGIASEQLGALGVGVVYSAGTAAIGNVADGGTFNGTVAAAGTLNVNAGGSVSGLVVSGSAAGLNVLGIGKIASGASAVVNVASGAHINSATVDTWGTITVDAGANATNLSASGGSDGFLGVSRAVIDVQGAATSAIANAYATVFADGGKVSNGTVLSGGVMDAEQGGTEGATVYSGGTLAVNKGAVISNATLYGGATLYDPGNKGWFGNAGEGSGVVNGATYDSITFLGSQVLGISNGSMSHATVLDGAGIGAVSSGAYISSGYVAGGADGPASMDALNGGTIFGGTAGSGGIIAVGGIRSTVNLPWNGGGGQSLLDGGQIQKGGLGVVGGNKDLTVTKHGTKITLDGSGIFSNLLVDAGGIADVNSQGTYLGGSVGGYALVESGGTISGVLFSGAADGGIDGANGYVDVGGIVSSNVVMSGALLSIAGGLASNNTVMAGGTVEIGEGYSRYVTQGANGSLAVSSGGDLAGGTSISGVVSSGGKQIVDNGGRDSDATVMQGGTMIVKAGGAAYGATIGAGQDKWVGGNSVQDTDGEDGGIITDGGSWYGGSLANGVGTGSTVDQMGGLIRVERGAIVDNLHMGDFGQIEVMGVKYGAGESVTYANNTITLMSNGQAIWSGTLDGSSYNPSSFQVWDDGGTAVIVYDQCFLRGTLISTPRGEIEIQHLKAGDTVWALVDGKEIERKITATRSKRNQINRNLPIDLAGWSVCIKAGAFGEGLPKRDLRVTPEHSFVFHNRLVPVRMLINGRTIYYDTSLAHFEFFHIETEPHSIIRAEGVLTESWLNTEERREAVNLSNGITRLERMPPRTWEKDAAAPLEVSANFVQPIWQKFAEYAALQQVPFYAPEEKRFSREMALRLRLENGQEIAPLNKRGNQYFFQLPTGFKGGYLVSKKFRPSESVGPWMDDRRQLGVLVGKMTVAFGQEFRPVTTHHHAANMQGWDVVESSPCRWTKGLAELPSLGSEEELKFGASLIVEILAGGPYPENQIMAATESEISTFEGERSLA
ncbi:hypothetical protein FAI41_07310 [Acetobacteraceae bacterium]|nr:hypothetical protein FAI41_07310 [Acetobacteraceae bacterium]